MKTTAKKPRPESWEGQNAGAAPPELPWTVDIAAAVWEMSQQRVRQLVNEGRVEYVQRGASATILILQKDRPERLPPGGLAELKRKAVP